MTLATPLLLAVLALQQPQTGPGEVRGTVHGEWNGELTPLPHALVEVAEVGRTRAVLADSAGRYVVTGVPAGLHRLRVVQIGFEEARLEVLVPADAAVTVDFSLAPDPVELAELLVRRDPLRLPEPDDQVRLSDAERARAAVAIHTLDATPGLAEAGLGEAARRLPGNRPSDPTDVLFMRGSTTDLKLVLLDGAPVYTPFHLGGLIRSFDAAALGAAEHHVGGAPARYDGGLSYILDLRTRSPSRERLRSAGAVDLMSMKAMLEGPVGDRAGVLVSSRALHGLGGRLAGSASFPYGYVDGMVRGELDLGTGQRLSLTGFGNHESVRLTLPGDMALIGSPFGLSSPEDARWGNAALALSYAGRWERTTVDVGASATRYRADLPFPLPKDTAAPQPPAQDAAGALLASGETERFRVTADVARPGRAGTLRFGTSVDYLDTRFSARRTSPGGGVQAYDSRGLGTVWGAYLDAVRRLAPELDLRYGARLDHFDPGGTRGALRLALLWSLTEDAMLTVAAGRYHQLTRASDADVELPVGNATTAGTGGLAATADSTPLLSVARADHVVLSLDQRLTPEVRLGIEGFYKRFDAVGGFGGGGMNSSGVDLRVLRQGERVTGWLGYSLSWFWDDPDALGRADEFLGRHLLSAGFRGRIRGPWGVDATLSYSDGLPLTSIPFAREGTASGLTNTATSGQHTEGDATAVAATDTFLRIDAEVFAELDPTWRGRTVHVRPYLRVLNALDRRDALFYYFERWRHPELKPLAELSVIPVLGVEWQF